MFLYSPRVRVTSVVVKVPIVTATPSVQLATSRIASFGSLPVFLRSMLEYVGVVLSSPRIPILPLSLIDTLSRPRIPSLSPLSSLVCANVTSQMRSLSYEFMGNFISISGSGLTFDCRLISISLHCAAMTDRKAVIKNADMSEDMQQDAIDCATQALEKFVPSFCACRWLSRTDRIAGGTRLSTTKGARQQRVLKS